MGEQFAEGVVLDLEEMLAESSIRIPMICFLSMGSDPTTQIINLAKKKKLECKDVSMGQGQEIHARKLLQNTMTNVNKNLVSKIHHCFYFGLLVFEFIVLYKYKVLKTTKCKIL